MPKKKFAPDKEHGFIGDIPYKTPKKVYIPHPFEIEYIRKRDDCMMADLFVSEETKNEILKKRL